MRDSNVKSTNSHPYDVLGSFEANQIEVVFSSFCVICFGGFFSIGNNKNLPSVLV